MLGMPPFKRNDNNLLDTLDNFTHNFSHDSNANLPAFCIDIRDAGDKFVLEVGLFKFDRGDVKLDVRNGTLVTTVEYSKNQKQEDIKGACIRRKCRHSSSSRSSDITGIDKGSIIVIYNNGILEPNLPKAVPMVPESRRTTIG